MARRKANQIGSCPTAIADFLGCNVPDLLAVLNVLDSLSYRDSIWMQYGINRSECWALRSLDGYLTTFNKVVISQEEFIDHLSGNFKHRAKFYGYVQGLVRSGCLGSFEYVCGRPGSLSIGISDFGFKVINAYYAEMNQLFGRYKPVGTDNQRSINCLENIPPHYRKTA